MIKYPIYNDKDFVIWIFYNEFNRMKNIFTDIKRTYDKNFIYYDIVLYKLLFIDILTNEFYYSNLISKK